MKYENDIHDIVSKFLIEDDNGLNYEHILETDYGFKFHDDVTSYWPPGFTSGKHMKFGDNYYHTSGNNNKSVPGLGFIWHNTTEYGEKGDHYIHLIRDVKDTKTKDGNGLYIIELINPTKDKQPVHISYDEKTDEMVKLSKMMNIIINTFDMFEDDNDKTGGCCWGEFISGICSYNMTLDDCVESGELYVIGIPIYLLENVDKFGGIVDLVIDSYYNDKDFETLNKDIDDYCYDNFRDIARIRG